MLYDAMCVSHHSNWTSMINRAAISSWDVPSCEMAALFELT